MRPNLQVAFDVSGPLWWFRWLIPSVAVKEGDGMTFQMAFNAFEYEVESMSLLRTRGTAH